MSNQVNKQKVLFLIHGPNPQHMNDMAGLYEMSFMGPLQETGLVEMETFWYREWLPDADAPQDWAFFQQCLNFRPDIIVVISWWHYPNEKTRTTLSLTTFHLLRTLLGVKIVAYLFDQAYEHFTTTDTLVRFCDIAYVHEHKKYFEKHSAIPERHHYTIATVSPKLFHADADATRDLGLVFVGGIGGYSSGDRTQGIEVLRLNGLSVTTPGGRGTGQIKLSNSEYASYFKRAKISLCWSKHISGKWYQAKGRIFESTLAGAMLLCEGCEEVDMYLTPFVDYIPFASHRDLVARGRYFLDNDDERLKVARSGHQKALSKYAANVVWQSTLQEIGTTSYYREEEAIELLRKHKTDRERKVAIFFKQSLIASGNSLSVSAVDDVIRYLS